MKTRTTDLIGILLFLMSFVVQASELFQEVRIENRFFNPPQTTPLLKVQTDEPVSLDVLIYDIDNVCIAYKRSANTTTLHEIVLNALSPATDGLYQYLLVARDQEGKSVGSYPKKFEGGERIRIRDSALNARSKYIEYILPRMAYIRIRAGIKNGPFLGLLLPWTAQKGGRHRIPWDGSVAEGLFSNLYDHPDIQVYVVGLSLPYNTFVNRQLSQSTHPAVAIPLPDPLRVDQTPPWPKLLDQQKGRAGIMAEADFQLQLEVNDFPASQQIELRVDSLLEDRSRLFKDRFEVMVYLDGVFLVEEELGLLPFSFQFSEQGLSIGRHVITVNIINIDGEMGTKSVAFDLSK